jgi:DNA invertase Pin-like site-specific DNA recombinase
MTPLPATDPTLAVAYRRVSSADQADHGYGLDDQASAIAAFVKREGLRLAGEFSDPGVSGIVPLDERPGLSAALDLVLKEGAGSLVVARHDRLARDTLQALLIERAFANAGARILYTDGGNGQSDSDRFTRTVLHAAAEQAKRDVVRRLKAGREAKLARHPGSRAQGGRVPYGYRRTATGVEVDPAQAKHVRRIFDLIRSGSTIRATAERMTDETGRRWQPTVVERIVKREVYKLRSPGRIIDARVWNVAQGALAARARR